MKAWYNGEIMAPAACRVAVLDHGLLYGDGVFEGIRITGRRVFRLPDHIRRLARSARAIGLDLPLNEAAIGDAVLATARANDADDAYVRIVLTRGVGELGVDPFTCTDPQLIIIVATLTMFDDGARQRGLRLLTSALRRPRTDMLDPQVKSLNYLNNVLVKRDARLKGFDDAIVLNAAGRVAEASGANLFAVIDGRLHTPPESEGALGGITRDTVCRIEAAAGRQVEQRPLTRYDLLAASEVFLTGSGAGLVAAASLDDAPLGNGERPTLERLRQGYAEFARSHGVPF